MYGLFHWGIIVHTALKENLHPFWYEPVPIIPVLWHHNKNIITFNLVVEYFGIMYQIVEDDYPLINELQKKYKITKYWTGRLYSGIRLVPAQDVHFFYTRSHLSALQNCALIF